MSGNSSSSQIFFASLLTCRLYCVLGACTEVYLRVFYLVKIFSHSRLNPRWYPLFPSVPATVPTNDDPSKQTRSRDSRPFGNQCKSTKHKTQHKGWPWEIISLNKLPTPPFSPNNQRPRATFHCRWCRFVFLSPSHQTRVVNRFLRPATPPK